MTKNVERIKYSEWLEAKNISEILLAWSLVKILDSIRAGIKVIMNFSAVVHCGLEDKIHHEAVLDRKASVAFPEIENYIESSQSR